MQLPLPPDIIIPVRRLSTAGLSGRDAHEAWVHRDWPAVGRVLSTTPLTPFHNSSEQATLGSTTVLWALMSSQRYEREIGIARRDGVDALAVSILRSGTSMFDCGDRGGRIGAGAGWCVDMARTHVHQSSATDNILLAIPRTTAAAHGIEVDAVHGRSLSGASVALLLEQLETVRAQLPFLTVAQGAAIERLLLDLLAIALATGSGGIARDAAMRVRCRLAIELMMEEPGLDIDRLSRRMGVSRAMLYRLLAEEGGVASAIRNARLDRIAQWLESGDAPPRLGGIAARFGFSQQAHFTRAFQRRFGQSPSAYRASHARPQ